MKKYYFLVIPVIIAIIVGYYLLIPNETKPDEKITKIEGNQPFSVFRQAIDTI